MIHTVAAELVGTVHTVEVAVGDAVVAGDTIILLESMKMEIPVQTEIAGIVTEVAVNQGDTVMEGDVIAVVEEVP
jgi:acetyl-CoA carboxylase biotin carboxyl carrier protein